MHPNVRSGHDALWRKFFNEETGQFYDSEVVDPEQFPTRQEIVENIPSCNAPNPVNDPTLQGSWILAGTLRGYALTGRQEYADKARKIFKGLIRLSGMGRTKGFIPRGCPPGLDVVYVNSSVDQHTGFYYATWRYCRSGIATEEEKRLATQRIVDSARLIESFHHDIPADNGRPTFYADMSNLNDVFRCCRLLHTYRTAFLMSGDEHWERLYREKLEEQDRRRLKVFATVAEFPAERPIAGWGLWQNQAALRMLFETETDPVVKAAYRASLDEEARVALPRLAGWQSCLTEPESRVIPDRWRAYWPEFVKAFPHHDRYRATPPLHHHQFGAFIHQNRDRIALPQKMLDRATIAQGTPGAYMLLACAMYAEDPALARAAAVEGRPMLTTPNLTRPRACGQFSCLEISYWRGVEAGLFPAE